MFKKRIVSYVLGITLALALTAGSGVVADALGFTFTPEAMAESCSSGGGC